MSDTELNRMRDFGCGKPHWSPYYVEAAYTHESRAIPGDKVSMAMTVPIKGEKGYASANPTPRSGGGSRAGSRAGSKPPSKPSSARLNIPEMKMPDPMADTFASKISSRKESARSMTSNRDEARRIEQLLKNKELELEDLRKQLAATKSK
jgi:hypothetical protein